MKADLPDTSSYVVIDPLAEDEGSPFQVADQWPENMLWQTRIGTMVRQNHGIHHGRLGTVVGYARGQGAHREFTKNQKAALAAGRLLAPDDFECLIDSEGPLIRWEGASPDDPEDWFPGQAGGLIAPAADLGPLAEGFRQVARDQGWEVGSIVHPSDAAGTILGLKKGDVLASVSLGHTG